MNDTIKSICIIAVFVVLVLNISMTLSKNAIQSYWTNYRCNPLIMPLAGKLSPDGMSTGDNFSYCIQDIVRSAAPMVTAPLQYVQSMTLNLLDNSSTVQTNTIKEQTRFSGSTGTMFGNTFNVLLGVVVEFRVMLARLTDSQSKLTGIMTTILYTMTAVQYTFESMWNGIPGTMIRSFSKINADKSKGNNKNKKKK